MNIDKAIEIKLQWRKDNYPPPLADEMNADMLSIEALKWCKDCKKASLEPRMPLLPGETPSDAPEPSLPHISNQDALPVFSG